jgi:hypothetical protein
MSVHKETTAIIHEPSGVLPPAPLLAFILPTPNVANGPSCIPVAPMVPPAVVPTRIALPTHPPVLNQTQPPQPPLFGPAPPAVHLPADINPTSTPLPAPNVGPANGDVPWRAN